MSQLIVLHLWSLGGDATVKEDDWLESAMLLWLLFIIDLNYVT